MNKKTLFRAGILLLSATAAEAVAVAVPDSAKHQPANQPYFAWLIIAITLVYFVGAILIHLKNRKTPNESDLFYRAPFLAGVLLVLNVLNIVTVKTALLPTLYFPSLDRVFGTLFEDWELILKCVGYSSGILAAGVLGGLIVGFLMGVGIGFSKTLSYWDKPAGTYSGSDTVHGVDTDFPAGFPTARAASAFIIGISVWFPTVVLTSSGISNVKNSYFEVASTLGANHFWRVFKVGVPAAMPSIFLGLFNGICSSFVTLMTAEMIGAKYGMGWYVNWQKEMMCYANVYAGLIVIAVLFYLVITVLFKVRDKVLLWQKGVIKW